LQPVDTLLPAKTVYFFERKVVVCFDFQDPVQRLWVLLDKTNEYCDIFKITKNIVQNNFLYRLPFAKSCIKY
jgi:hypothetical protein